MRIKDIPGYEGRYAATEDGRIWSHISSQYLAPADNGQGYFQVDIRDNNGKRHKARVNRLIALTFLGEAPEGMVVAHLDDNKQNNQISNLAYQTQAENLDTPSYKAKAKIKKFSKIRCVETGEIFESQAAAARFVGKNKYGIYNAISGKQKTCGGYHWERVEST